MNKRLRFSWSVVLLLVSFTLKAQQFVWTSTIVNTNIEYSFQALCTAREELCTGGEAGELSYRLGTAAFVSTNAGAEVNENDISAAGSYVFVHGFDGKLKWHSHFGTHYAKLNGLAYDNNNRLVALVYQYGKEEYTEEETPTEPESDAPEEPKETRAAEDLTGYCLYSFDSTGEIESRTFLPELYEVTITDFKAHPAGGFVFTGHADGNEATDGKFVASLPLKAGPAGCDFLLFIAADGRIPWGDALSYQSETCCSYGADPKLAIDEKGIIYIGGSYEKGARFGGKITKFAKVPYNPDRYFSPFETYVAAYSPTGTFLWVNTAGAQSRFTGLAAAAGFVYVATQASKTGTLFEHAVDTADHQTVFITVFDRKGGFKRNISTGAGGKAFLSTDATGKLIVTGTIGIETGFLKRPDAEKEKRRRENCFIAWYAPGGNYLKHRTHNLLMISSDNPPVCLAVNSDQYYLVCNLWASFALPLRVLDTTFPDVKFSAGAPCIVRVAPR